MSQSITFKGDPVTLEGQPPQVGQKAPDFQLTATDLGTRSLKDYEGKVKIISIVLSVDTSVCDAQTRAFNQQASNLGDDVAVLTISMDLPFAFKRWCGAAGVDRVECLSDYRDHNFTRAWGLRVKELGLLARCVFVLDRDNTIKHAQVGPELSQEPDYDKALAAAKQLV